MLKDVGKGYYCEYWYLLPSNFKGCIATKRTSCVGCGARHRKFKNPNWLMKILQRQREKDAPQKEDAE